MNKTIGCECEFKRIRPTIKFGVDIGVHEMIWLVQIIKCLCKGRKIVKRKNILQCRKCGRYSIECPYCHQSTIMEELPEVTSCPHCGKVYQAKLFEF